MSLSYHLTFDIDWAPDPSIDLCLQLLDAHGVKATFFTTHETDMNREIFVRGHELGIHPNFLPGSIHGSEVEAIVETCLGFAPEARFLRTHSLYQSSRLFQAVFGGFPQLTTDLSLFMHKARHVQRCRWSFGGISFDRVLYNWEDDAEFDDDASDYSRAEFFGPSTIYNFHPIHVDLNSRDQSAYDELRSEIPGGHVGDATPELIAMHRSREPGTADFMRAILASDAIPVSIDDIH